MLEIVTVATYLLTWCVCKWIIGIESGLITLIISVGLAVSVYIVLLLTENLEKKGLSWSSVISNNRMVQFFVRKKTLDKQDTKDAQKKDIIKK